jgi:hypothetical protein
MISRSTRETLESLRITLQKLEQAADPASNGQDIVELKQILLNRIAELETLHALQPEETEREPAASDLPPLAAVTEDDPAKAVAETIPAEKFD